MLTLKTIALAIQEAGSVYVEGDTRAGKTRSLAQMALKYMHKGRFTTWWDCPQLLDEISIKAEFPHTLQSLKLTCLARPILVLDDLGKGKMNETRASFIYDIIDRVTQMEGKQWVWVSTNKSPDQLAHYFGDYGRPLVGRLGDLCSHVNV